MSAALEIQLADAVVSWLEGGTYSKQATFERTYSPEVELKAGVTVARVQVFPTTRARTNESRGSQSNEMAISAVVTAKLTDDEVASPMAAMDSYMKFREELETRISATGSPGVSGLDYVTIATEPIFAEDHLKQLGQFTAVIVATFKASTPRA